MDKKPILQIVMGVVLFFTSVMMLSVKDQEDAQKEIIIISDEVEVHGSSLLYLYKE